MVQMTQNILDLQFFFVLTFLRKNNCEEVVVVGEVGVARVVGVVEELEVVVEVDGGIVLGGVSLSSPFLFLPPLHALTLTDGGPIFCKIDSNKKINKTKLLMKF